MQNPQAQREMLFISAARASVAHAADDTTHPTPLNTHETALVEAWNRDQIAVYEAVSAMVTLATRGSGQAHPNVMEDAWDIVSSEWGGSRPIWTCLELRRLFRLRGLEPS
ncbi:MAG: hypothetical protein AAB804_00525 [Patescibacteria group bacterium]